MFPSPLRRAAAARNALASREELEVTWRVGEVGEGWTPERWVRPRVLCLHRPGEGEDEPIAEAIAGVDDAQLFWTVRARRNLFDAEVVARPLLRRFLPLSSQEGEESEVVIRALKLRTKETDPLVIASPYPRSSS